MPEVQHAPFQAQIDAFARLPEPDQTALLADLALEMCFEGNVDLDYVFDAVRRYLDSPAAPAPLPDHGACDHPAGDCHVVPAWDSHSDWQRP